MDSGPGTTGWLLALFIVASPTTLLHELGHAVAARRRLDGDVLVEVGLEPRPWKFSMGGIDFAVSPLTTPIGHAGTCIYRGWATARDTLAISLGGPAATALGFVAALGAVSYLDGFARDLAWMAAVTQGFGLVLNLIPFRLANGLQSDGMVALDALRTGRPLPAVGTRETASVVTTPPRAVATPLCATCGHGRDEHVDLLTGRRGTCAGQHYDFQTLAAHPCECGFFLPISGSRN